MAWFRSKANPIRNGGSAAWCPNFALTRIEDRLAYYEAVVRPWLWFLGNTTDCRIFQNMTAVEIVEKIFSKYGTAKFEKRLQGSYPLARILRAV